MKTNLYFKQIQRVNDLRQDGYQVATCSYPAPGHVFYKLQHPNGQYIVLKTDGVTLIQKTNGKITHQETV